MADIMLLGTVYSSLHPSLLASSRPPCLSVCLLVWQQANTVVILQTIFLRSSPLLRRTSLSDHNPRWHHQNPFWCVFVYVRPSPLSLPLLFPTEWMPAHCVCWLTGAEERRLFSAYPETLPCQVWDEILSIVLTPHSRASRGKALLRVGGWYQAKSHSVLH